MCEFVYDLQQNGPVRWWSDSSYIYRTDQCDQWSGVQGNGPALRWSGEQWNRPVYIYVGGPAGNITQTRIQHRYKVKMFCRQGVVNVSLISPLTDGRVHRQSTFACLCSLADIYGPRQAPTYISCPAGRMEIMILYMPTCLLYIYIYLSDVTILYQWFDRKSAWNKGWCSRVLRMM